jgi:hypothetical protein
MQFHTYYCESMSYLSFIIVKMYPQGRMSHHFREMNVGDYLSVKGPKVCQFVLLLLHNFFLVLCLKCMRVEFGPFIGTYYGF